PASQSTNASSTTSTARIASRPRSGASVPAGETACARSRMSSLVTRRLGARDFEAVLARGLLRLVVAGVEVAEHTCSRIRGQDPLEPLGRVARAVGNDDHARVDGVADPDAPAVMNADPRRPGGRVQESVQD